MPEGVWGGKKGIPEPMELYYKIIIIIIVGLHDIQHKSQLRETEEGCQPDPVLYHMKKPGQYCIVTYQNPRKTYALALKDFNFKIFICLLFERLEMEGKKEMQDN